MNQLSGLEPHNSRPLFATALALRVRGFRGTAVCALSCLGSLYYSYGKRLPHFLQAASAAVCSRGWQLWRRALLCVYVSGVRVRCVGWNGGLADAALGAFMWKPFAAEEHLAEKEKITP